MVAPGMTCQYIVQFFPDCLGDFDDFILVETQSAHTLLIPLQARRPPPVLTCERVLLPRGSFRPASPSEEHSRSGPLHGSTWPGLFGQGLPGPEGGPCQQLPHSPPQCQALIVLFLCGG